ncbi:hypothetical protein HY486_00935 [Candidatus Woesearchaeota archaeon]|nr:hypothetical protein [Candidatus Woesearchaeota archaeon]
MVLRRGMKVVIARSLGLENKNYPGEEDEFYFPETGGTGGIPLGSEGTVLGVKGNRIFVRVKNVDVGKVSFHIRELDVQERAASTMFGGLPLGYFFGLASEMPVFLVNDRVYCLDGLRDSSEFGFFQTCGDGGIVRRGLVEHAALSSLEGLTRAHHAKEFSNAERKYLKGVVESGEYTEAFGRYRLVDFIVGEVFPHFRSYRSGGSRVGELLGAKTIFVGDTKGKSRACESRLEESVLVSRLIQEVERERFKGKGCVWDGVGFFQDGVPVSLLGRVLGGRDVAVVDGFCYALVLGGVSECGVLNFGGRSFGLVCPNSLELVKQRYDFELSKCLRVGALRNQLVQDKQLRDLFERTAGIAELVKKKQYSEGSFGFVRADNEIMDDFDEDKYDFRSDPANSGPGYFVFLDVPAHVLKEPGVDKYYFFKKLRIGVSVFFDSGNNISYAGPVSLNSECVHPFVLGNAICLGGYNFFELDRLKPGEAVAKLLVDAKRIILSGYGGEASPFKLLEYLGRNLISLSEVKRRGLPITNVNYERSWNNLE